VDTLPGQEVDREGFLVAYRLGSPWTTVAEDLRVALPVIGAVILAPLSATALRSGRGLTVARVGTLVLAAPVAARALRTVLDRPWLGVYGMPENTYPSGHVALTAAVAVGIVALLPRSVPRLPALTAAAGVTLAAAAAAVVSRAHRPADAVGALLLVAALGAASHCAAVLARALRRRQAPAG
jgi:membrane-associated phospholipid phosphatase